MWGRRVVLQSGLPIFNEPAAPLPFCSVDPACIWSRACVNPADKKRERGARWKEEPSTADHGPQWKVTLLAPALHQAPNTHDGFSVDPEKHAQMLRDIQAMRGDVYREYEPIAAQLLSDGRHYGPLDEKSWHIVLHTPAGYILGSSRYRVIESGFEIWPSATPRWRPRQNTVHY